MPKPPETDAATEPASVPRFRLERIVTRKAQFEELQRAQVADGESRPKRVNVEVRVAGAIQVNPDVVRAAVTLDVEATPDPKWQPYRINVAVSGGFVGENVTVEQLDQFCRFGVPPILFPYVRETVHRLTMDAAFGAITLDPINIAELLAKSWPART